MTHIANNGDHKFDHIVGGYKVSPAPAHQSIDDVALARPTMIDALAMIDALNDALEKSPGRGAVAVIPREVVDAFGAGLLSDLMFLAKVRRRLSPTPLVIPATWPDVVQGRPDSAHAPDGMARLNTHIAAGRLR